MNTQQVIGAWSARRIFLANLCIWGALSAAGAVASYAEMSRAGHARTYWYYWTGWGLCMLPQVALCSLLQWLFIQRPALGRHPSSLAWLYLLALAVFVPVDLAYKAVNLTLHAGTPWTAAAITAQLRDVPSIDWFIDFALLCGSFAGQAGWSIWRQGRTHQEALDRSVTENLRLHLELEQLRMLGLRAQLEPHFMFNALNAISALVRSGDQRVALSGIGRLSGLLRYALSASGRDWTNVADELAFVQDYLALQQLRYGQRLQVSVEGMSEAIGAVRCPPLLLQPLVENALRHDLDCHALSSDISLRFAATADGLRIQISNPLRTAAPVNPGLGLGLRHTRSCLSHAFGGRAALHAGADGGRFRVVLDLPVAS